MGHRVLSIGGLIAAPLAAAALWASPLLADIAPSEPMAEPEPAPEPEAPKPPPQPDWISDAEAKFFNDTGGLRPIASYDSDNYLVTIKLKKAGLSMDSVYNRAVGPKYDYYKYTKLVETSFAGRLDGKLYLFTGTVAGKVILGKWVEAAFVPVVTRLTSARDADKLTIEWSKSDAATSMRLVDENAERLKAVMADAGVDDSWEDYRAEIEKSLGSTSKIWGRHVYYPETGYYIYQQKAVMESAISNVIAAAAGKGDIIGAALKVGYQVLGEPGRAGPAGELGPEVTAMDGETVEPGR